MVQDSSMANDKPTNQRIPTYMQILFLLWMLGLLGIYWLLNDRVLAPSIALLRTIILILARFFSFT